MRCSVDLTSFGLLFDDFTRSAMRDKSSVEYLLEGEDNVIVRSIVWGHLATALMVPKMIRCVSQVEVDRLMGVNIN